MSRLRSSVGWSPTCSAYKHASALGLSNWTKMVTH